MSTKTIEKELKSLKQEVASLRSLVFSAVAAKVKDREGKYKPKFVKDALSSVNEKAVYGYTGKGLYNKEFVKGLAISLNQFKAGKAKKISSLKSL